MPAKKQGLGVPAGSLLVSLLWGLRMRHAATSVSSLEEFLGSQILCLAGGRG